MKSVPSHVNESPRRWSHRQLLASRPPLIRRTGTCSNDEQPAEPDKSALRPPREASNHLSLTSRSDADSRIPPPVYLYCPLLNLARRGTRLSRCRVNGHRDSAVWNSTTRMQAGVYNYAGELTMFTDRSSRGTDHNRMKGNLEIDASQERRAYRWTGITPT
jgi:hypothetical protein